MQHAQLTPVKRKSDTRAYLLICLLAGIPVYWACLLFSGRLMGYREEWVATSITIAFFGFFYIGWRMPVLWFPGFQKISNTVFLMLSTVIVACVLWLFIHADTQIRSRPGLNLMLFLLPFALLSFVTGLLVKLVRLSIQNQLQHAEVTAQQSQSELQLLQSQLSPHFLFNTLNNLYGLSISHHEKVPPLLLKLSDLLRYSVYDVKELFVPLKNELAYINNYVEFERIRIGDRLALTMATEAITTDEIRIAPMLLITFIENAFKHSKNTADKRIYIDISLRTFGNKILFSVKNSYNSGVNEIQSLKKDRGLGLANAKKRLELLYPGEHELEIEHKDGFYQVMLQLKMK